MNAEVRDQIQQCSVCNEFQVKNQKQPMQSHHLPDRPWSTVATDQFKLFGKEFIVLVDFFSDFIEVKHLQENTSSVVIEFLKEQFSRYGIPDTLITDNALILVVMNFDIFRVIGSFYTCHRPHTTTNPMEKLNLR